MVIPKLRGLNRVVVIRDENCLITFPSECNIMVGIIQTPCPGIIRILAETKAGMILRENQGNGTV